MSWKDIKQPSCPRLSTPQLGQRLGLAHSPPPPPSHLPQLHSVGPWRGKLMMHGEGITLTLTGRCPILCLTTINNMAASGAFASEKKVNSESYVLTASCSSLTTFFTIFLFFLNKFCLFVFLFDLVIGESFGWSLQQKGCLFEAIWFCTSVHKILDIWIQGFSAGCATEMI